MLLEGYIMIWADNGLICCVHWPSPRHVAAFPAGSIIYYLVTLRRLHDSKHTNTHCNEVISLALSSSLHIAYIQIIRCTARLKVFWPHSLVKSFEFWGYASPLMCLSKHWLCHQLGWPYWQKDVYTLCIVSTAQFIHLYMYKPLQQSSMLSALHVCVDANRWATFRLLPQTRPLEARQADKNPH